MESDLVILGLPQVNPAKTELLITHTDKILQHLKTVLLIKASTFFKPIYIGIEQAVQRSVEKIPGARDLRSALLSIELPAHDVLAARFQQINSDIEKIFINYQNTYLQPVHQTHSILIDNISGLVLKSFDEAEEIPGDKELQRGRKAIARIQSNYLFNLKRLVLQYKSETVAEVKTNLADGTQQLLNDLDQLRKDLPTEMIIYYEKDKTDQKKAGRSLLNRIFKREKPIKRKIQIQDIFLYGQRVLERKVIYEYLKDFGIASYQLNSELQKLFNSVNDSILAFETALQKGHFDEKIFTDEKRKIELRLEQVKVGQEENNRKMLSDMNTGVNHVMQSISMDLDSKTTNRLLKKKRRIARKQPVLHSKILEAADYWQNNQQLISNFFVVDLHLKSIQNRMETILGRMQANLMLSIDTNYKSRLTELTNTLSGLNKSEQEKLIWSSLADERLDPGDLFDELHEDILTALEEIPEEIEIISEESFQKIEQDQFDEVAAITVNLRRYAEVLVETELIEPLQKELNELNLDLEKTDDICQEVVRFVNYNLSVKGDMDDAVTESLDSVITSGRDRLENRLNFISEKQEELNAGFERHTRQIFEKMNPVLVSRAVGELKHTIRSTESRKYLGKLKSMTEKIKIRIKNILVRLIYQRSESVLFAKKLGTHLTYQTSTGHILDTVKTISPDSTVQSTLPFYYRQLFFGTRQASKEFLVDRELEMEQAARALDLYGQGFHGALLILSDRFAGKSTLSMSVAIRHFERSKSFQIYPPEGGSTDPQEFKKRLSKATQVKGNYDHIFNALPQNCVLIVHDLEMWWQRSVDGFKVIDELTSLINKYGSKCFFIVNCTRDSFHFINRIRPVAEIFIRALECQPFDAEDIQTAILLRHQSSGLKFRLGATHEERLSNLRMAHLFNAYFDISGGNIGYALHYWVSNIKKVSQNILEIRTPVRIGENAFSHLSMEWIVWLQQFLLHRNLTLERLEQISGQTRTAIADIIYTLKRSGIILEEHPDVLSINPYLQPLLVKRLREKEML